MSFSSDAGNLPLHRHIGSSSEEEVLPNHPDQALERQENAPREGGANPRPRQQMPSDPVALQRGRRGARSSQVFCFRVSTGQNEEKVTFYIDNDLLIQLVEGRPALWDRTDRQHADHNVTRLLWHEICEAIVPNWKDLRDRQRDQCRAQIMVRWRSIRDRYKKDYNEELRARSGSVGTSRRQYRYHAAMRFLRRTLEMRRTTGSTQASEVLQEALPDEPANAGSSGLGQTTGQDTDVPLHRQRVGRSRQADYKNLTRFVYESLMGSANRVATLEDHLVRLKEGAQQMSPVQNYLKSLVPVMEQFTPDQLFEARRLVDCALWHVQHLPPSFPPSQPYSQSQSFLPHSHHPSHSRMPEQLSHPFSPFPYYFPPTSFTAPSSQARDPPPPSVALAPARPFLPPMAEQPENRGILNLL